MHNWPWKIRIFFIFLNGPCIIDKLCGLIHKFCTFYNSRMVDYYSSLACGAGWRQSFGPLVQYFLNLGPGIVFLWCIEPKSKRIFLFSFLCKSNNENHHFSDQYSLQLIIY